MKRTTRSSTLQVGQGFALFEVLIALVILLVGLLGLVGISSRANVSELEALQRVQALTLLRDMSDRLNANRAVAACYSGGATGLQLGSGYTGTPVCASGTIQQQSRAVADLQAWDGMLKGSAETLATNKVGAMIGAVGCVTQIDAANNIYLIAVSWQGMAQTAAPVMADGSPPCGKGQYGDEKLHRTLATTVRIANLTAS